MGLSTHVLDTMHGCPAAGMAVALYAVQDGQARLLRQIKLNQDGRSDMPLLDPDQLQPGSYRLLFDVGGYFKVRGVALPDPPFLGHVPIDFHMADIKQHYHVPLLTSPWSYATYRGS